ncbi:MAG TPA: thiamine pyrophosphate-dependent enzyme, partial [Thermodesulfovibrionales bacterium]|nr:thiamine pyrophosphate-dependent enzyme [Thermodesulfovibrionales bacterium]
MKTAFEKPRSLKAAPFRYCPGCGHSLIHRLVAESVDALGIKERLIGIAPIGCAVFAYDYFDFDVLEVAHGRPPAAATAMKRVLPDRIIFSYQGDGDLAAIGTSEIIHAAARGENITVFFINNATYGMTGGQMAPTTLLGQRTSTTTRGRDAAQTGHPLL